MLRYVVSLSLAITASAAASAQTTDLEISAHGGGFSRTQENATLSSLGPVIGLAPLFRVSEAVAIGLLFEYARLNWSEAALGGLPSASVDRWLLAGAFRWHLLGGSVVDPYLQLAGGYVAHSRFPEAGGCSAEMPVGVQLTGGVDAAVASWARIGGSISLSGGVVKKGCVESTDAPPVHIDPGLGFSTQATFTTVWERAF